MNKQQRNLLQIQKQFWKRAMHGDKIQYDLAEQIGRIWRPMRLEQQALGE